MRGPLLSTIVLLLVVGQLPSARGFCQEPCDDFLQALLGRRLHDVAMDYLVEMETSPLASEDFKRRIPLARVRILRSEASTLRDPQRVTEQLDLTEKLLAEFLATNPPVDLLAEAQQAKADILMSRARRLLDQASSDRLTVQQQNELRAQARSNLEEAGTAFESIRQRLRSELENFKTDPGDPESANRKERMQNDYVQVRFKSPRVKEQIADSLDAGDPLAKKQYEAAVAEYLDLFEKYRTKPAGFEGCLGAARCLQKLGDNNRAQGYLMEVFDLGNGNVQNQLKRDGALVAIKVWSGMEPYPAQEAFMRLQPIIYSLPPDFARSAEGITLRMEFARICNQLAVMIAEKQDLEPEERKQKGLLERESVNILRGLVRINGAHRDVARKLLAEWEGRLPPEAEADVAAANAAPPENLAEARQRAVDIQLAVQEKVNELLTLRDQQSGGDNSGTLSSQINELVQAIRERSMEAIRWLDVALAMVNDETTTDDLASIRLRQVISYFQLERFEEATIIANFLLERYGSSSSARQAAGFACKSLWRQYVDARKRGDGSPEATRVEQESLAEICQLIFSRFADSEESEVAAIYMMQMALDRKDPVAADEFLAKIPATSPTRGRAMLDVGYQLWREYVLRKRKGDEDANLRQKAEQLLHEGMDVLAPESLTPYQARVALSLVEAYLESGNVEAAHARLESEKVAPLDLVKNKHKVAEDPQFRRDTLKTAIRVYLARLRDAQDVAQWIEKSRAALDALKAETGNSPEGQKQLAGIYLTLANELKSQFDSLESNDQRKVFAEGLDTFLVSLADSADDPQLMMLAGTMLNDIGQSLSANGLTSEAARFFDKAAGVFENLANRNLDDERMRLAVLRGRANALRGTGKFEQSVKLFGDILADEKNRRYLDLQVDAATALAEWGLKLGDVNALVAAVQGGEKREGTTTIFGWTQLAKIARRDQNSADFARAIWYLSQCKARYGEIRNKPEMKQAAIEEIENFAKSEPEMGGTVWKSRLDKLLAELRGE
jgi:tetratricopeptide (TPR) repeat protein